MRSLSQGEKESNPRRYNFGPGDNPVWTGMYHTEALKVGSTLVAAELVTSHQVDVAFSFSGGMHHAGPAFASGFCVFNDAAVAIHLTTSGYTAALATIEQLAPRWLALGGGGYDIDVVARSWTLAYGIMSDQEFPDELPAAYAEKVGHGSLRDHEKPHISSGFRERARSYAEDGVAALKGVLAI